MVTQYTNYSINSMIATMVDQQSKAIIFFTERCKLCPPSEQSDADIRSIYSDKETMKNLLFLSEMDDKAWSDRREFHRTGFKEGKSLFLDIFYTSSNTDGSKVIGTTGFKTIENGVGEWGIILGRSFILSSSINVILLHNLWLLSTYQNLVLLPFALFVRLIKCLLV